MGGRDGVMEKYVGGHDRRECEVYTDSPGVGLLNTLPSRVTCSYTVAPYRGKKL